MGKIGLPVWTSIGAGLIIVAIVILGNFTGRPKHRAPVIPGQAAGTTSQVYLRGGILQQNLGSETPQAFLEEETRGTLPGYKTKKFTVRAGEIVSITLRNNSKASHEHGWVLVQPGMREKVEDEAKAAGPQWGWIPNSTNVLAFVPMTQPGQSHTAKFRAPPNPGDYPFFCPFPGHGRVMHGTLHVVASNEAKK